MMVEKFAWPDNKKVAVSISFDDARKIKLGMTAEQVLEIMGPPTNKSIDLSGELWMWIYVDWNMDSKSFAVQLKDDAVVHIIE